MLLLSQNPTTVLGGITITGNAAIFSGSAVVGLSQPWALYNFGTLQGTGAASNGVDLEAGGTVLNGANGPVVGSISGGTDGVVIRGAAGTVTNGASGSSGGLITGGLNGVELANGPGTVSNFGQIEATATTNAVMEVGVRLSQGGTLTNNGTIQGSLFNFSISGNTISGGGVGVVSDNSAAITNSATIHGGAAGIYLDGSGSTTVTNFGTIEGVFGIDAAFGSGSVTVVNHGVIESSGGGITLPAFVGGAGDDRVVVFPGAVFVGSVNGGGGNNTLELAAGSGVGTISGLGNASISQGFANFGVVSVDDGASWIFQSMQSATDTINLAAAQVEFSGAVQAGHTVAFTTGGATAKIDNVAQFAGNVTGFGRGDVLDFAGVTATGVSYSSGTLTLLNGGIGFVQIAFSTPMTNPVFSVTADGSGGTDITLSRTLDDFNSDNKTDILWRSGNGSLVDWDMNGGAIASSGFLTANGTVIAPDPSFSVAGLSDFSGDGNTDVLWRSTSGALIEWTMNGSVITSSANITLNGAMVQPDASFSVAGVGDFNGDGKSDVLWRSTSGALAEWTMNGSVITSSANVTFNGAPVQPDASFSVAGVGDFNGDGERDILWRSTSGALIDWTMNGSVVTSSANITFNGAMVQPDASYGIAGIGDFNGDGKSDILWRSSNGSLVEWLMNGSTIVSSGNVTLNGAAITPDASWHVVEVGDFNGDSQSDVLWRNDNGSLAEWLMNGTTISQSLTPSSNGVAVSPDGSFTTQAKPTNFG